MYMVPPNLFDILRFHFKYVFSVIDCDQARKRWDFVTNQCGKRGVSFRIHAVNPCIHDCSRIEQTTPFQAAPTMSPAEATEEPEEPYALCPLMTKPPLPVAMADRSMLAPKPVDWPNTTQFLRAWLLPGEPPSWPPACSYKPMTSPPEFPYPSQWAR